MIVLYHCESARSFRPLWMLEEMNLEYELRMLPFPPRVFDKSYFEVNPLGTVPTFFDGSLRMTESSAICQYLAERFGPTDLKVDASEPEYADYLNWLYFGEATLTFPQTLVLRYGRFEPNDRRAPQVVEDYGRWFLARLRAVQASILERPYLCGERFTAADVSVGYALMLAEITGLAKEFPSPVSEYWQRLQERPGYQRAFRRQEMVAAAAGIESWLRK